MKKINYRRNIFALTIHLMFSKRITGPVMMLFYQSFNLNYGQIGTLASIAWLSDALMEVVGGAFSDVHGRRRASLLYASLGMTGMAVYALGTQFWHFALASAIYGISIAIGSGNASALLYDTLKILKLENQYKKFRGKMQFPPKMLNGLIFIILPLIYMLNIRLPFVVGFMFYLVSFLTALFFIVEPLKAKKHKIISMKETVVNAFFEIFKNRKLKQIIAIEVLMSAFLLLGFEYYQPLIKAGGIPLVYFGVIYAGVRLFEGTGSLLIHKFERHSNVRLLAVNVFLISAALLGFAFTHNALIIIFIFFMGLSAGIKDVVISDLLNKNISSANRTTIMSTANLFDSLFIALIFFIFGHVSDLVGVQGMFLYAFFSMIVLLVILSRLIKKPLHVESAGRYLASS